MHVRREEHSRTQAGLQGESAAISVRLETAEHGRMQGSVQRKQQRRREQVRLVHRISCPSKSFPAAYRCAHSEFRRDHRGTGIYHDSLGIDSGPTDDWSGRRCNPGARFDDGKWQGQTAQGRARRFWLLFRRVCRTSAAASRTDGSRGGTVVYLIFRSAHRSRAAASHADGLHGWTGSWLNCRCEREHR